MRSYNQSINFSKYCQNNLYFIEPDPIKIQEIDIETDTTELRKLVFRQYPYIKTFFPEVTTWS